MAAVVPSAHASLSRQPRQTDAPPSQTIPTVSPRAEHHRRQPYPPYLGTVFYSFPLFSFTLPLGGSLKLLGIELIPP